MPYSIIKFKNNSFAVACSHNRAWAYYAESVNNEYAFPAYTCDSYDSFMKSECNSTRSNPAYMGYIASPR